MAQVLNLSALNQTIWKSPSTRPESSRSLYTSSTLHDNVNQTWSSLQQKLTCNGRFSCLFSDNRKEVQKFLLLRYFLELIYCFNGSLIVQKLETWMGFNCLVKLSITLGNEKLRWTLMRFYFIFFPAKKSKSNFRWDF